MAYIFNKRANLTVKFSHIKIWRKNFYNNFNKPDNSYRKQ